MSTHAPAFRLRITANAYADALRRFKDGDPDANPLRLPLILQGGYALFCRTAKQLILLDIATKQPYVAAVPAALAEFLAGFHRGEWILGDREFELALESPDD